MKCVFRFLIFFVCFDLDVRWKKSFKKSYLKSPFKKQNQRNLRQNQDFFKKSETTFSKNLPLGRFFYRVAMSGCLCVVPFPCKFFLGLSLALRSHDQIPASHWLTNPPPLAPPLPYHFFGKKKNFGGPDADAAGRGGGRFGRPPRCQWRGGGGNFFIYFLLKSPLAGCPFFDTSGNKNIGATIRIGWEILCLPYAGFLKQFYSKIYFNVFCA